MRKKGTLVRQRGRQWRMVRRMRVSLARQGIYSKRAGRGRLHVKTKDAGRVKRLIRRLGRRK